MPYLQCLCAPGQCAACHGTEGISAWDTLQSGAHDAGVKGTEDTAFAGDPVPRDMGKISVQFQDIPPGQGKCEQ